MTSDDRPHEAPREEGPHMPRPVKLADAPAQGLALRVEATAAERAAIAAADGLAGLESLVADLLIAPDGERKARVTGRLAARLTQVCVVTLEPFDSALETEIEADFAAREEPERRPAPGRGRREETHAREAEIEAEFDPIVNGEIDVGALVEEFFVLALDPYPRRPGAAFDPAGDGGTNAGASPFAALGSLKKE